MPKTSKAQSEASNRYAAKSYDRLYPFVPKGRKAEIQAAADRAGETLNEFIVNAIDQRMEREKRSEPFSPPLGEYCTEACKKRCVVIEPNTGKLEQPWCAQHEKKITERDEHAGELRKLEECLHGSKEN